MATTQTNGMTPELFASYYSFKNMAADAGYQTGPLDNLISGWIKELPTAISASQQLRVTPQANTGQRRARKNTGSRSRKNTGTETSGQLTDNHLKCIATLRSLGGSASAAQIAEKIGLKPGAVGQIMRALPGATKDGAIWTYAADNIDQTLNRRAA